MKTAFTILVIVALAAAVPKPAKLRFRNLFKKPIGSIATKTHPRIIGGQEAVPHSIPYQAFLEIFTKTKGWYCGGSLISTTYILTAGHCGDGAVEAHVTLGAHKPLESETTQKVLVSTNIKVHEDYDDDEITNDIGLIKLPEAVALSDAIQLVALPSRVDDSTYEGVTGRISGWGLTDGFGSKVSEVLNYVDVEVINNEECEKIFGSLLPSVFCTSGVDNTGSCSGDSGGPLVADDVQIGVVSFGIIFCFDGFPSGFTKVASFLDWIEENSDVVVV